MLLDNQSNVNVFKNAGLVCNIRTSPVTLDVYCNAGVRTTNGVADFDNYGEVWYDPGGRANILSLSKVKNRYRVYYNSADGGAFVMVVRDGKEIPFQDSSNGLYVYDTPSLQDTSQRGVVLVNMVAENASMYTPADYSRAQKARRLQVVIGRPSLKDYLHIVNNNLPQIAPSQPKT